MARLAFRLLFSRMKEDKCKLVFCWGSVYYVTLLGTTIYSKPRRKTLLSKTCWNKPNYKFLVNSAKQPNCIAVLWNSPVEGSFCASVCLIPCTFWNMCTTCLVNYRLPDILYICLSCMLLGTIQFYISRPPTSAGPLNTKVKTESSGLSRFRHFQKSLYVNLPKTRALICWWAAIILMLMWNFIT